MNMTLKKCGYSAPEMQISLQELDFCVCAVSEGGTMDSQSGAEELGETDFGW